ncbi:MAG: RDD family protein [Sulfurovaceae bacterium]|jgi:uncharacterized RDD family membrane protein YckC
MQNIASTQKRMGAFVIDDIVISFLIFAIFYNQIMTLTTPEAIMLFMEQVFIPITLLKIAYHTFLVWNNGMTVGKYIMKIRVVSEEDGTNLNFVRSLLRAVVRIFSEVIFYIGFILAFFSPKVQTLHDKIAGAIVIDA